MAFKLPSSIPRWQYGCSSIVIAHKRNTLGHGAGKTTALASVHSKVGDKFRLASVRRIVPKIIETMRYSNI